MSVNEPAPAPRLDGFQILVVDDHDDNLDLLREVFTSLGAVVEAVNNTPDALMWLEHKRADVIVSDLSMPKPDGLQLMRDIRALPGEAIEPTPAIALTAYAREEDRQRAVASGYDVFLAKPIDPFQVAEEILRLVRARG